MQKKVLLTNPVVAHSVELLVNKEIITLVVDVSNVKCTQPFAQSVVLKLKCRSVQVVTGLFTAVIVSTRTDAISQLRIKTPLSSDEGVFIILG